MIFAVTQLIGYSQICYLRQTCWIFWVFSLEEIQLTNDRLQSQVDDDWGQKGSADSIYSPCVYAFTQPLLLSLKQVASMTHLHGGQKNSLTKNYEFSETLCISCFPTNLLLLAKCLCAAFEKFCALHRERKIHEAELS